MMLQTFVYTFLWKYMSSVLLVMYLGVESLGHTVSPQLEKARMQQRRLNAAKIKINK